MPEAMRNIEPILLLLFCSYSDTFIIHSHRVLISAIIISNYIVVSYSLSYHIPDFLLSFYRFLTQYTHNWSRNGFGITDIIFYYSKFKGYVNSFRVKSVNSCIGVVEY